MTAMMVGGARSYGSMVGGGGGMGRGGGMGPAGMAGSPPGAMGVGARLQPPPDFLHPHMHQHQGSPSPRSPPSPVSSDPPTSPGSPGARGGNGPKACGVCGDLAKSMHFGGLSCDSCKAFFRRSVQNHAYKGFTCPYEQKCIIAVSSRKACQYCRFHKCLSIGMEKGWVMTEDERRKMMKQRAQKKTEVKKEEGIHRAPPVVLPDHKTCNKDLVAFTLSEEDHTEINIIVSLYRKAYQDVPYEEPQGDDIGPGQGVMSPWMTFCKRIGYFFSLFREFADLSSQDQSLLLKTAITSACIIMGSVVYDPSSGQWPGKGISRAGFIPNVTTANVEKVVPSELLSRVESFFKKFQQVCPDETMAMILILVALYSPELMGLTAKDTIQSLQDRYTNILQRYVQWKYREQAALMFPKVIVSLADIRELAERTYQMRIQQGATSSMPSLASFMKKPTKQNQPSSADPGPSTSAIDTGQQSPGGMSVQSGGASPYTHERSHTSSITSDEDTDVQVKMECDKKDIDSLMTATGHKRARAEGTADDKDAVYQRIMQKIEQQMHQQSIYMKVPTLLPFIIQIVKEVGAGGSGQKSLSSSSSSSSHHHHHARHHSSGSHHHHRHHHHRSSGPYSQQQQQQQQHKWGESSRGGEVKQETNQGGQGEVEIKEELMDTDYEVPRNVQQQQHHHQQQQQQQHQQQHHHHQQQHPEYHNRQQQLQHQPMSHSPTSQNMPSRSPHELSRQQLSPPLPYGGRQPYPSSPMSGCDSSEFHSRSHHHLTQDPHLPGPHSLPPHTSNNPYNSPPQGGPTPPHHQQHSPMAHSSSMLEGEPIPSPMAAPSPYSDSSSNSSGSSPESSSSQNPYSSLFDDHLSNVEIDVLTQLLDYVANCENWDNMNPLREVLPSHLLNELQNKLKNVL